MPDSADLHQIAMDLFRCADPPHEFVHYPIIHADEFVCKKCKLRVRGQQHLWYLIGLEDAQRRDAERQL